MSNVNDKLKELEEQAKKKANQEEVKKIQQSAQAVQQKLSSNPSAVGTVNNNTYTPVKSSSGNVVKKTGTQVVTGIPTVNQQKAYNDVFSGSSTQTSSPKLENIQSRASLNNTLDWLGNLSAQNRAKSVYNSSNDYTNFVNNLYSNKGASMTEDEYNELKRRTAVEGHNAQSRKATENDSIKLANQLLDAYKGKIKENEKINKETANIKEDYDSNGYLITKYLTDDEKTQLRQLETLVKSNTEITEDLKKRYEELKEKNLKEKKAQNILENYIYDDNYKNLTDEEKQAYLSDIGSRNLSGAIRYGKTVGKNLYGMASTPFKVADAIRNTQNNIDLNDIEGMFIRGEITEDEYNNLSEKLSKFDINSENNISNILQKEVDKLSYQAYNGLSEGENLTLQTLDSTTNFLMNFYLTSAVGGFLGASDDVIGTAVTMGMSAQSGADKYYQNIENGYDPETSMKNALLTGALSYLSENLPTENYMKLIGSKAGNITLAVLLKRLGSQAGEEALEEGFEYLVEPIIDKFTLGTPVKYEAGDLFLAMGMGALSGGLLGAVSNWMPSIQSLREHNQLQEDMQQAKLHMFDADLSAEDQLRNQLIYKVCMDALNDFENRNKTAGALVKESDLQIDSMSDEQASQLLNDFTKADRDTVARYNRVNENAQKVLNNLGIDMDAFEYASLTPEERADVKNAQKITNRANVKTVYSTKIDSDSYGYYDPETKTLYVNPKSGQASLVTWIHEMTHDAQFKKDYPEFSRILREYDTGLTEKWSNILKTAKDSKGNLAYSGDEFEYELDSHLAQELLSDENFLNRLVGEEPSTFEKVMDSILGIKENESLKALQDKFTEIYNNNYKVNNENSNSMLSLHDYKLTKGKEYFDYDNLLNEDVGKNVKSTFLNIRKKNHLDPSVAFKNAIETAEHLPNTRTYKNTGNKDAIIVKTANGDELSVNRRGAIHIWQKTSARSDNSLKYAIIENTPMLLRNAVLLNEYYDANDNVYGNAYYVKTKASDGNEYVIRFTANRVGTILKTDVDLSLHSSYYGEFNGNNKVANNNEENKKNLSKRGGQEMVHTFKQGTDSTKNIVDLIEAVNNSVFKDDLSLDVLKKLNGDNYVRSNPKRLNTLYSKKLNINSNEDANGVELSENQKKAYENVSELLRDDHGRIKRYYHGTQRGDRVGNEFRSDRATAGPMSYFTDTKSIADNYSKDKADTSIQYNNEYEAYSVDGKDLDAYYNKLSSKDKNAIKSAMYDIGMDEDWENIVKEKGANYNSYGKQTYDYYLRDNSNNPLYAMYRILEDNGDEGKFGKVLDLLGIKHEFDDPYASNPKTYEVYLNVTNPLDTNNIPESLVEQFRAKADELEDSFESNGNIYAWDKNAISPKQWMEFLDDDIANGRTHAWTIIPDFVTDILKQNGYDGVSDVGGKNGGVEHQVVIPFYANQIKNVDNLNPTSSNDIRYSKKLNFDSNEDSDGTKLSSNQKKYFKDSKVTDENGNLMVMYHGTSDPNFTVFDPSMSDDGISLFFTNNPKVAETYSATGNVFGDGKNIDAYNLPKTIRTVQQFNEYANNNGIDLEIRKIDQNFVENFVKENVERDNEYIARYSSDKEFTPKGEEYYRKIAESHIGEYLPFHKKNNEPYGLAWASNEHDLLEKIESDRWVGHFFGSRYPVYLNITNPLVVDGSITDKYENASIELDLETWEDLDEKKFNYNILDEDGSKIETKKFNSIEELMNDETFRKYVSDEEANRLYQEWMDKYNSAEDKKDWIHLKTETKIGDYEKQDGSNWKQIRYNNLDWSTRDLSRYAKDNGYDGLIMKNIYDIGGYSGGFNVEPSDVVVAFNSNQVKATNNVKPTSDPDIRFAKKLNLNAQLDTDLDNEVKKNGLLGRSNDIDRKLTEVGMNPNYVNNAEYVNAKNQVLLDIKNNDINKEHVQKFIDKALDLCFEEHNNEYAGSEDKVRDYLKKNHIDPEVLDRSRMYKKNTDIFDDYNSTGEERRAYMNKLRGIGVVWDTKNGSSDVDVMMNELANFVPELSYITEMNGERDKLDALYDYVQEAKENAKKPVVEDYSKDPEFVKDFESNVVKALIDASKPDISIDEAFPDSDLNITDEEFNRKVKQPNFNTRMESMKKSFLENTDDWLPDVEFLRKNYPDFSEENINEASFEIFAFGDISEQTKQKLADNIIATEFNGNEEQYNESNKTGVVDQFVNEAIERFATNTFYQQNKKKLDPVANKTNEYIKAFSGYEGSENVDSKFAKVSEMVKLENEIKETRKASVDQTVTIGTLFELGKDNISHWRTLEQNLDEVAGKNTDLRKQLQEMLELPRYQAQITNARILTDGKNFVEEYAKNGFASGSRESALAQYMLEGHTEEVVGWKKAKDGSTYPDYKSFNEDDLVKEVGREKADKIIEYSKQLRDRYDDLIYQINNARIQEIYGDVEVKNDLETMKLLAKVEQAGAVVEKLKQRMLNETNNPKLEAMYQRAKANFNKLSAQYNTKVENDLSGDSTRRQLVPYRTNYAHHIVDKGNFFQQLAQAFKGEKTTPTALSGIADRSKPKSGFASFMMKQDSANYIPDATQGFIEYLQQSSKTIAYDPLINYYRNINNDMRALAKDNTMSKFVEYMDDYANDLAGKTNEFDRGAKKLLGQKTFNVVKVLNSRVKPNALLFNVRSALVQAGNLPNALDVIISKGGAKGSIDVAKGTYNYLTDLFNKDAVANQSPFLTMRYDTNINNGDTSFMKSAEKFGAWMIGVLDESVTKATWYSAYEQAQRMGVKDPIFYADDVTRRAVAGRDTGEVPLALKSELVNLAMPFQLEVQNVWNTMKGNARDKELGALMVALITSWLMNNAYDKLFGDRVLFDPIDAIVDGLQEEDKGQAVVTRLAGELVSAVPLAGLGVQQFMSEDQREKFFGEADPTRYGTQNISVGALGKALAEASQGNTIEPIATLFYAYGMPFGGTQAKRVIETLQSYGYLPKHVSPDPDSLSEFNEWEMSPINYSKKGKITYVNDDPFKSTDNFFDFAKQLAFGKHVGKGNQAYVDSGFKTMSDSQRTVFDAFNTKLSEYNAYQVTQEYKNIQGLKDENGKTVSNSEGLQKRKALQDNGVWEEYKKSNEEGKNGIGKTVYNMDNSDFQKAYNEAMSKAVDKPTEVTKVEPEQKKNESSLADYFNSVFGKKKEEKPTEEVVAKNTTTEETKEKPFNINDYDKDLANLDKSNSGHYYQKGTRGLESNQREVGQYRYYKQPDGTYDLQVWNGKKFETKAQNVDVTKVGKKKTNSSSSKKTSSKSTKTKADKEYESKKKKALAVLNGSSSFSNVEKILNSAIKNNTLDSTLSSMRSKFKSQYSSLISRYLKAHPEARAMFK